VHCTDTITFLQGQNKSQKVASHVSDSSRFLFPRQTYHLQTCRRPTNARQHPSCQQRWQTQPNNGGNPLSCNTPKHNVSQVQNTQKIHKLLFLGNSNWLITFYSRKLWTPRYWHSRWDADPKHSRYQNRFLSIPSQPKGRTNKAYND